MKRLCLVATSALLLCQSAWAGSSGAAPWQEQVMGYVNNKAAIHDKVALDIAEWAELGYIENKSSARLQNHLKNEGFKIEANVAEIPTAFIATYGTEGPIIGIVAEYDALPGFSQAAQPVKISLKSHNTGHACGHHLLGTAAAEAAVAIKTWLEATGAKAIIRVYGSPAEEGGGGKVYLTRAGLFDDVDAVMNWHPGAQNTVVAFSSLASYSGKFRFYGISAHAAEAPEQGRSALDGVEAMNDMVNMMREHIPEKARIHYVITSGGSAPNVVPDFAEVYYNARHPDTEVASDLWQRIERAAKGAALGTDTTVKSEIINAIYPVLPNNVLSVVTHRNLEVVGGVYYTDEERKFAKELAKSFGTQTKPMELSEKIGELKLDSDFVMSASTDVGDVSWVAPTNFIVTATWVPGTSAHSWQAVAAGTMSIGLKGMHVASKTMALTAIDLIQHPELLKEAKAELNRRRGDGFKYKALLGNRKPPLDYRN